MGSISKICAKLVSSCRNTWRSRNSCTEKGRRTTPRRETLLFAPGNELLFEQGCAAIDDESDRANDQDSKQDEIHVETLAACDDEPTDAGTSRHEVLGADRCEPGVDQREM